MSSLITVSDSEHIEDVTARLTAVLATLRKHSASIPIERARAIVSCAASLIDTVKVEAQISAIKKGRS